MAYPSAGTDAPGLQMALVDSAGLEDKSPQSPPHELYRSKRRVLISIATRITRNSADAEDLVQLAFLKACEHRVLVPEARLVSWLRTVVRRLSIDQLRRRAVHIRYAEFLHCSESEYVTLPTMEELDDWVRELPNTLQPTFRMWSAGASYKAIALGQLVPIGTVATRVLRAKQYLRARCAAARGTTRSSASG